ncbi:hypothetical protein BC832DRAFT_206505 [Gaertneriomyces semiglobifer]|nr:hypothetical protein BC832DRAFT_206505 [Gaertneriomyces semiglobifer]
MSSGALMILSCLIAFAFFETTKGDGLTGRVTDARFRDRSLSSTLSARRSVLDPTAAAVTVAASTTLSSCTPTNASKKVA